MNGNAGTNQIGAMAYGDEGIEKGGGGVARLAGSGRREQQRGDERNKKKGGERSLSKKNVDQ